MNVSVNVTEVEPTWLLISFNGDKPPADSRAFWLSKALNDWLANHASHFVKRTLPIQHEGELVALHVWLTTTAAENRPLTVKIDQGIMAAEHKEHLEAFMQQAHAIFFERCAVPVLAVINRVGFAAVFNRAKEQAYVVPAVDLKADEETMASIKAWLSAPDGACFVVEFA